MLISEFYNDNNSRYYCLTVITFTCQNKPYLIEAGKVDCEVPQLYRNSMN